MAYYMSGVPPPLTNTERGRNLRGSCIMVESKSNYKNLTQKNNQQFKHILFPSHERMLVLKQFPNSNNNTAFFNISQTSFNISQTRFIQRGTQTCQINFTLNLHYQLLDAHHSNELYIKIYHVIFNHDDTYSISTSTHFIYPRSLAAKFIKSTPFCRGGLAGWMSSSFLALARPFWFYNKERKVF